MKRFLLLVTIVFFTIAGFAQTQSYTIKGKIFNLDLNGESIDLVELGENNHNTTIQNTKIENGEFLFSGTVDTPTLWMLLIENHKIVLVAENADLAVEIYPDSSKVSGTKINDDFQEFVDKSNAYRKQLTKQYASYQVALKDSPEKHSLQKQLEEMENDWHSNVIVKFIKENVNNPAGQRAFKSLLPDLSVDELKDIIANVDSVNMQNPLIQQGVERINTLEAMP